MLRHAVKKAATEKYHPQTTDSSSWKPSHPIIKRPANNVRRFLADAHLHAALFRDKGRTGRRKKVQDGARLIHEKQKTKANSWAGMLRLGLMVQALEQLRSDTTPQLSALRVSNGCLSRRGGGGEGGGVQAGTQRHARSLT